MEITDRGKEKKDSKQLLRSRPPGGGSTLLQESFFIGSRESKDRKEGEEKEGKGREGRGGDDSLLASQLAS